MPRVAEEAPGTCLADTAELWDTGTATAIQQPHFNTHPRIRLPTTAKHF